VPSLHGYVWYDLGSHDDILSVVMVRARQLFAVVGGLAIHTTAKVILQYPLIRVNIVNAFDVVIGSSIGQGVYRVPGGQNSGLRLTDLPLRKFCEKF
jgi:hypothetical protein